MDQEPLFTAFLQICHNWISSSWIDPCPYHSRDQECPKAFCWSFLVCTSSVIKCYHFYHFCHFIIYHTLYQLIIYTYTWWASASDVTSHIRQCIPLQLWIDCRCLCSLRTRRCGRPDVRHRRTSTAPSQCSTRPHRAATHTRHLTNNLTMTKQLGGQWKQNTIKYQQLNSSSSWCSFYVTDDAINDAAEPLSRLTTNTANSSL